MVSTFHPDQGTVEVMAWDTRTGGFNFYRTVGPGSSWVFAGNSRHALAAPTRDNGPFESHKSGHFLMKELRFPWVNWDSPAAKVVPSVLTEQGLQDHPWVSSLAPGGAYTLEDDVALPSIVRWTRSRLQAFQAGASAETPRRIFEQLLDTPAVNLMSSRTSSAAAVTGAVPKLDLPDTFFVDTAGLAEIARLKPPPRPFADAAIYAQSLVKFAAKLSDGDQFSRAGDTHFAFVVPERAFEDTETIRQAVELGIITRRLVACLLMVDFPNPIFSAQRRNLLKYVPDTATTDGPADVSSRVAEAILAAPEASQTGTAEHEFAELWNVGEPFENAFNALLDQYYSAFMARLQTPEGFESYVRLAESRRALVREMPIAETPLLFSQTNVPPAERSMRRDGTVEEA